MGNNFKVIIAGGGPAGLVAAHSLHLAGVDFTVLEARDVLSNDQGASLVLAPQSMRVMHQFGLLDRLMEIGAELKTNTGYSVDGQEFGKVTGLHRMKDNFGCGPVAFHRAQLIDTIYDGLPEEAKSRVLTGKKIINVAADENGVEVTCADGSVHNGSVIVGADGVHSRVRGQMRKLALQEDAEDRSVLYIPGKSRGWMFLSSKLPKKTKERVSYTEQDVLDYADSFAEYAVTPDFKVKDLFARRSTAGMSNLEEGVVEHWTWGRLALVGDACHKYTPNKGLGFNNGIQDVVTLCNGLVAAVHAASDGFPSLDALSHVFQTYQDERRKLAEIDCARSSRETRVATYANLGCYFLGHYVYWWRWVQYLALEWIEPRSIRKAQVLDYVVAEERLQGAVSWLHPMKHN